MNKQHKNIQFTFENEINDEIPFFDVIVKRKDYRFYTSQYFKNTDKRLYLTPMIKKYNDGLKKTIFNRTWEVSSNYSIAQPGIEVMKNWLIKTDMQKKEID